MNLDPETARVVRARLRVEDAIGDALGVILARDDAGELCDRAGGDKSQELSDALGKIRACLGAGKRRPIEQSQGGMTMSVGNLIGELVRAIVEERERDSFAATLDIEKRGPEAVQEAEPRPSAALAALIDRELAKQGG